MQHLLIFSYARSSREKTIQAEFAKIEAYYKSLCPEEDSSTSDSRSSSEIDLVLMFESCGQYLAGERERVLEILKRELVKINFPCAIIWTDVKEKTVGLGEAYPEPAWVVAAKRFGLHPQSDDIPRRVFSAV